MFEEMTTEDVEKIVMESGKLVLRIPLMGANDIAIERSVGFLRTLEDEVPSNDIDVIIFSNNAMTHSRVSGQMKSAIAEKLAYRLHLDFLPYSEFIVSIPKTDANDRILRKLCLRFGLDF